MTASTEGDFASFDRAFHEQKALERALSTGGVEVARVSRGGNKRKSLLRYMDKEAGLSIPTSKESKEVLFVDIKSTDASFLSEIECRNAIVEADEYPFCINLHNGERIFLLCRTPNQRDVLRRTIAGRCEQLSVATTSDCLSLCLRMYWPLARSEIRASEAACLMEKLLLGERLPRNSEVYLKENKNSDGKIDFSKFVELYKSAWRKEFAQALFCKFVPPACSIMSAELLQKFLCLDGDTTVKTSQWALLGKRDGILSRWGPKELSLMKFTHFLMDPHCNSIVDEAHLRVVDSMDHPISDYFINSSHNTYLTGNQFSSASESAMYSKVLQDGGRCIEIDCWNGPRNEPRVLHGRTLTRDIPLKNALQAIKATAFKPPLGLVHSSAFNPRTFPVILSLEVHTNSTQTERLAHLIMDTFGEQLLKHISVQTCSPQHLENKVLVKWRMNESGVEESNHRIPVGTKSSLSSTESSPTSSDMKNPKAALSRIATIGAIKTSDFGASALPFNVQSYTEGDFRRIQELSRAKFILQNTRMMSRIYPDGDRVQSDNYNPMEVWKLGCQMAALNFQTRDEPMLINQGFFAFQNGGCGYVLKPDYLRNPEASRRKDSYSLSLRIICGSHLRGVTGMDERCNVFLKVWVHGDTKPFSTKECPLTMYPEWEQQVLLRGSYRSLDVLCVDLYSNYKGCKRVAAGIRIPVRVIRNGLRAIPLRREGEDRLAVYSSIFCEVAVKPGDVR